MDCENLLNVTIPASVRSVGRDAFRSVGGSEGNGIINVLSEEIKLSDFWALEFCGHVFFRGSEDVYLGSPWHMFAAEFVFNHDFSVE